MLAETKLNGLHHVSMTVQGDEKECCLDISAGGIRHFLYLQEDNARWLRNHIDIWLQEREKAQGLPLRARK